MEDWCCRGSRMISLLRTMWQRASCRELKDLSHSWIKSEIRRKSTMVTHKNRIAKTMKMIEWLSQSMRSSRIHNQHPTQCLPTRILHNLKESFETPEKIALTVQPPQTSLRKVSMCYNRVNSRLQRISSLLPWRHRYQWRHSKPMAVICHISKWCHRLKRWIPSGLSNPITPNNRCL